MLAAFLVFLSHVTDRSWKDFKWKMAKLAQDCWLASTLANTTQVPLCACSRGISRGHWVLRAHCARRIDC